MNAAAVTFNYHSELHPPQAVAVTRTHGYRSSKTARFGKRATRTDVWINPRWRRRQRPVRTDDGALQHGRHAVDGAPSVDEGCPEIENLAGERTRQLGIGRICCGRGAAVARIGHKTRR